MSDPNRRPQKTQGTWSAPRNVQVPALAMLTALALDAALGDPPNRFHPTAWMGSLISYAKEGRPRRAVDARPRPTAELAYGGALVASGMAATAAVALLAKRVAQRLPPALALLAEAALLKTTLSLRGLDRAAGQVQSALHAGDLPEARRLVSYHLVSRDTSALDEGGVAAAAIESVAENASDGVIAPLFWYCLGGLPAALAYRFANTADAMLGYHSAELEWLGKIPARLDDALNWLPARLSGLLLALVAPAAGGSPAAALRALGRDARATASPNAGYPMSAAAGALDVALEKHGHYHLNAAARRPSAADIGRARRLLWAGVGMGVFLAVIQDFNAKNTKER